MQVQSLYVTYNALQFIHLKILVKSKVVKALGSTIRVKCSNNHMGQPCRCRVYSSPKCQVLQHVGFSSLNLNQAQISHEEYGAPRYIINIQ